jgi:hypothetical protein
MSSPKTLTQSDSTADATHAAKTAVVLIDNSGGTASQTLADITEANSNGSADRVPVENAIASLADEVNKLIADHRDLASFVNSLVDALQNAREIRAIK